MRKASGIIVVILAILISTFLPFHILPRIIAEPFEAGRWGMRPILFALLISVWLAVDRLVVLTKSSINGRSFLDQLRGYLSTGNVTGAIQYCEELNKPLSRIVAAGLAKSSQGEVAVKSAMDERAYGELPQIEVRTGYLALMGNVATLMGLFGTIIGLIHSFGAVSGQSSEGAGEKATLLAAGISEAMNCTAFGLLTGIAALLFYSSLNGRTQAIIDEINHLSLRAYRLWKISARKVVAAGAQTHTAAIAAPNSHLMTTVGLYTGEGGHGRKKRSTFASLQLTPLIDMFIVMVIFLLMSFSASGELPLVAKDIKVPFAEQVEALERAPVVSISFPKDDPSGGVVTLEGQMVSTAKELMTDDNPDWNITRLTEGLKNFKENWKVTHPNEEFPGQILLHIDQEIDFRIIKKVMYSAGLAGFGQLHFAVSQKATGSTGGAAAH